MKSLLLQKPLFDLTCQGIKTETRRTHNLGAINQHPDRHRMGTAKEISDFIESSSSTFVKRYNAAKGCYFFLFDTEENKIIPVRSKFATGEKIFLAEPVYVFKNPVKKVDEIKYEEEYSAGLKKNDWGLATQYKKRSKLLMKAEWARYWVSITGVRLERLFDITQEGCFLEGILNNIIMEDGKPKVIYGIPGLQNWSDKIPSAKQAFFSIFASVAKDRDETFIRSNPFVFVYNYTLCSI